MRAIHAALPLELVLEILRYFASASVNKRQVALQLSQLDVVLRSLVVNTSTFWNTIAIKATSKSLNFVELCLSRSKGASLYVSFSGSHEDLNKEPNLPKHLIKILGESAHRLALPCSASTLHRSTISSTSASSLHVSTSRGLKACT